MLRTPGPPIWKAAPFLRLLLPLCAGIVLQRYKQPDPGEIFIFMLCFGIAYFLFLLLPLSVRYKLRSFQGLMVMILLAGVGAGVTWKNDVRHDKNWYGNHYHTGDRLVVRIDEPPAERSRSIKAVGVVESVVHKDSVVACKGKLLLYFSPDTVAKHLQYGDRLLIGKNIEPIRNSGNPGAFDYEQYAALRQSFHQVFLKEKDWLLLPGKSTNGFRGFLYASREKILAVLRQHAPSGKDELGIAEALLIGYTNDLDRDLLQAYSNTGVVHVIAISGMHLALIYVMLVWIFARTPLVKSSQLLQVTLVLGCLWFFSLLTGGSASVLRSAVMFTFVTIGKNFIRQSSIYNSLAASAFVLLCYDPYFLWDVGFQLSYLALLGIMVFQKPFYTLFIVKNRWMDKVWQLASVTLAAQVFTFPVCIYYFHQFPVYFLLANLFVVPWSSGILYMEIFLLVLSWVPFLGDWLGKACSGMLWLMNWVIKCISHLPFSIWEILHPTLLSTLLLYGVVTGLCTWLAWRKRLSFLIALAFLLLFVLQHAFLLWTAARQQKVIVYNIPKHVAIDFAMGRNYRFSGDLDSEKYAPLRNLYLKPAHDFLFLSDKTDTMAALFKQDMFYQFGGKRIVHINNTVFFGPVSRKIDVDLIVMSNNPELSITQVEAVFHCRKYVFDASNSLWKIARWQADCSALHLQSHSVPEKGAFVMEL
jgi:competence protein ComEC